MSSILDLPGFPIIEEVNKTRHSLWNDSHNEKNTIDSRVVFWLGHKAFTVISLPLNIVGIGLGAGLSGLSICTLGAFKVAIFAITLGNVKLEFSTGFLEVFPRGVHSIEETFVTLGECIYDWGDVTYQGYRAVKWIGVQLQLGGVLKRIQEAVLEVLLFFRERFAKGLGKAIEVESKYKDYFTSKPLEKFNSEVSKLRISLEERPFSKIIKHGLISLIAIPANGIIAVITGIATAVLGFAFIMKAGLYSLTGICIPIPTFVGQTAVIFNDSAYNTLADVGTDFADIFITAFKITEATGLVFVAVSTIELIAYIPEAIFS